MTQKKEKVLKPCLPKLEASSLQVLPFDQKVTFFCRIIVVSRQEVGEFGCQFLPPVRDMQLVIMQNVFGTCSDKTDADHRIKIIIVFLESC